MFLSTATVPLAVIVSPSVMPASWVVVTVTSLLPSPVLPVPSCRWIQFKPRMPALYLTTTPWMVTGVPVRAARPLHRLAIVMPPGGGAIGVVTVAGCERGAPCTLSAGAAADCGAGAPVGVIAVTK